MTYAPATYFEFEPLMTTTTSRDDYNTANESEYSLLHTHTHTYTRISIIYCSQVQSNLTDDSDDEVMVIMTTAMTSDDKNDSQSSNTTRQISRIYNRLYLRVTVLLNLSHSPSG